MQASFCSRLLPVFIIFKVYIPNSTAVLHEGRRHITDTLDGADVGTLYLIINGILFHAGKEGVEAVLVGSLVGRTQPDIADAADVITEIGDGVVAVG